MEGAPLHPPPVVVVTVTATRWPLLWPLSPPSVVRYLLALHYRRFLEKSISSVLLASKRTVLSCVQARLPLV